MKVIPIALAKVSENRQRREFPAKKMEELTTSILSKGLLHPPVFRFDGEFYWLVAGERRLRSLQSIASIDVSIVCNDELIPTGTIPITLLGDLDPLALREAELEENTIRLDLTWQEQASAVAELDSLRAAQAERDNLPHTARATASEIIGHEAQGSEITRVTEARTIAKHLDDPDVAKAKSPKEALKVIRKKAEAAHREVLAANFNPESSPHNAILGSCFDYTAALPNDHFDCILTDPPYGIGADGFGDMAGTAHNYADDWAYAKTCYSLVAHEGMRVTREAAHAYVFLDPRYWAKVSTIFSEAGWEVWPTPLIWNKLNGMLPKPEYGPRRTYEMILFASKGGKKVLKVGPDILTHALVTDRDHGAQKPVPLFQDLLSRSCYPGDAVLDLFMGSGTIFPAANRLKLSATGMEIDKKNYNLALTRLATTEDVVEDVFLSLGGLPG